MSQESLGGTQSTQPVPDQFSVLVTKQNQQGQAHDENCSEDCCEVVWKPKRIANN